MVRLLLAICFILSESVRSAVIETKLGKVEGTTLTARNGRPFNAYYAIPYAKAPIGNLRFQPPEPVEKWNGTYKAKEAGPRCPQIVQNTAIYAGVEDCLHLNVFTPQHAKPGDNIPVIVYIFGGAFNFGSTEREGPLFMMDRDIILVMVNYRLSTLGFLSTGDTVVPGNMGLKDQRMALLWTRENIDKFGGDPNRVTLQGHSSGAASVHFHTLSPLSKGLYHRAIMQSGQATSPHLFSDKDYARSLTINLARKVNCTFKTSKQLVECLLTKEPEVLIRMSEAMKVWQQCPVPIFRPTVEDTNVEGAFLTEVSVLAHYPSTNESWLIGMTSGEAVYYIDSIGLNTADLKQPEIDVKLLIPMLDYFLWTAKPNQLNYITQMIVKHIFGDEEIGPCTGIVQMMTGIMHGMPVLNVLQKYKGTKYVYLYDYEAKISKEMRLCGKYLGVPHSHELNIIFNIKDTNETEEDYEFGEELITRWINFAYSGNPNEPFPINKDFFGPWSPMTSPHMEYLLIKKGGSMQADYFRKTFGFWTKLPIFSKYQ